MKFMSSMFAVSSAVLSLSAPVGAQDYPMRDITTAVVFRAEGGTDSINRLIMSEMEKLLPVGISVINQAGGVAGSSGMVYEQNQPDDGVVYLASDGFVYR